MDNYLSENIHKFDVMLRFGDFNMSGTILLADCVYIYI